MFGKRKRNNLYCIKMSHSEEWLIFFYGAREGNPLRPLLQYDKMRRS